MADRSAVVNSVRTGTSASASSTVTTRSDLTTSIKTASLPQVTTIASTTVTTEEKAAELVISNQVLIMEPTEGFLYLIPAVDPTGYASSSAKFSYGKITKTGTSSSSTVGRYVLYLTDQALVYGPGVFLPWSAVVTLF